MFKPSQERLQGHEIVILGPYRPWGHHKECGGTSSGYPEHSGRILDVKQNQARGINYFYSFMQPRVKSPDAIAVVPSHDPNKGAGGLHALSARLATKLGLIDASTALVRHTKIKKLADGGDRSVDVHLASIHVPDASGIKGKKVLLIDDVMTTGHSLLASRRLLLEAGASSVKCVALGRTTY